MVSNETAGYVAARIFPRLQQQIDRAIQEDRHGDAMGIALIVGRLRVEIFGPHAYLEASILLGVCGSECAA